MLQRGLPAVAAVVVVVVVILLLIWINGKPSGKSQAGAAVTSPPATSSATPTPTPTPTPSPTPRTTPTPSVRPTPSASQRRSVVATTAQAPVVVLNNSTISGLAARVAAQLRAAGWHVVSVGNAQGRFPQTTLFYARGQRAAARHLAHDFGSIQVVRAAAGSGVQTPGHVLTLIVTRYWE